MRRLSIPPLVTFACIGVVVAVVVWAMDPSLLLANTTDAGGDTGAHVALSHYLMTTLLPHGHVTGWDPGAYDGFPLYTFYFPLPDAMAAIAGYLIPFNVAFKLVTILGSLCLPVAAWGFGRLAGLERPRPAVLAAFTLPFLFEQSFTIYGGNLYSTLAGEYSYSLGLSIALVFLGVCFRGMRTGRMRVWAAVLIAACVLCHVITALFALVGAAVVLLLSGPSRRRLWWMVSSVGTGLLLTAWWAVPFVLEQAYTTSMGWRNVTTYVTMLAPGGDLWAIVAAAAGVVIALVRRDRAGILLMVLGAVFALAVRFDPQGKLYNTRFLPLWWLCVYLLAGLALAEVGIFIARQERLLRARLADGFAVVSVATALAGTLTQSTPMSTLPYGEGPSNVPPPATGLPPPQQQAPRGPRRRHSQRSPWAPGAATVPLVALSVALLVVLPDLFMPASSTWALGPVHVRHSDVTDWARWNYSGYERKAGWPELDSGIVPTLDQVGERYGCGRVMWEYNSDLNRFGTPEALMDLPMWTGGCMDSMEGLLFESSATTPYHFVDQSELSAAPSDAFVPQDGLTYGSLDVALGVQHLQLMGVRYFMASSPSVQQQADADPSLSLVAKTGPWTTSSGGQPIVTTWKVYLVHGSALVSPLQSTPSVLQGVRQAQSSWLSVAFRWYDQPAQWSRELVAGGPPGWPRLDGQTALAQLDSRTSANSKPLPAVQVTDIKSSGNQISFNVNRVGVPVLVKTSYFPNWHAQGASGPWRAEPNLMVVIPRSPHVSLTYGSTPAMRAGELLSLVALAALVVLFRRRDPLTSR